MSFVAIGRRIGKIEQAMTQSCPMDFFLEPILPGTLESDLIAKDCFLCGKPYCENIVGATGKFRRAMEIIFPASLEQFYFDSKVRLAFVWLTTQPEYEEVEKRDKRWLAGLRSRVVFDVQAREMVAAHDALGIAITKLHAPYQKLKIEHPEEGPILDASEEEFERYIFGKEAMTLERGTPPLRWTAERTLCIA